MPKKDDKSAEQQRKNDDKKRCDRVVDNGVVINCPDNHGTVIGRIEGDFNL